MAFSSPPLIAANGYAVDAPNLKTARREAMSIVRAVLRDELERGDQGYVPDLDRHLAISDERGKVFAVVHFRDALD